MMIEIKIKPLSVNKAWKGRKFKTNDYIKYEHIALLMLPKINKLPSPPYILTIHFNFSSNASDLDNPVKPFLDILQKKYGIDDKNIFKLILTKSIVKKGEESILFNLCSL
jgi:Holliday junction resolvase RusA-like endonuclease